MNIQDLVMRNARNKPDDLAVCGPDAHLTYRELDRLANCFAYALADLGVQQGGRVGIWLNKSAWAVAAMQGVLRLGAIYVPLDPLSPTARIATIVHDCNMSALVTTHQRAQAILTGDLHQIPYLGIESQEPENSLLDYPDTPVQETVVAEQDIAYILYTSGSTGTPKGVCISHQNALSFVEWASHAIQATSLDRFANHAPFHFDLSVLDLYVAFYAGATTYLIPDQISYLPQPLVTFLTQNSITVWYSVPSVLIIMIEQGRLLELPAPSLRVILFAGEPFPIKHLRRLHQQYYPQACFFNLYGPTETNVCTAYEVMDIPENWNKPVPIGKACSGDYVWAKKEDGTEAQPGEEGELMVTGPTVMVGYWGQPAHGNKPYSTGDLVQLLDDGNYVYISRRDRQVKIRGRRIELGDIEAVLGEHPALHEVAVAVADTGLDARLVAFIVPVSGTQPTLLELKKYCAERLPRYMIIDNVCTIEQLPRTRNGKIDRLLLARQHNA
jgi:amino acid adenylation domain-containing protein